MLNPKHLTELKVEAQSITVWVRGKIYHSDLDFEIISVAQREAYAKA